MPRSPVRPSPPDPSKIASGKPGAVQLVHGDATGVFSSRKLERATYDSVAFCFIAANDHPGHDTVDPCAGVRVLVDRDHGFRWKMITQSGGT
jgi:hypothetical protein